jgi:mono/diheme cytochrome c family protein
VCRELRVLKIAPSLRSAVAILACLTGFYVAGQTEQIYQQHCAGCHGATRLGVTGPALLPEVVLAKPEALAATISGGLPATQMPGFASILSAEQINALAEFILSPAVEVPNWNDARIEASRIVKQPTERNTPVFNADPLNIFVVVETGDHHVTILDGDNFVPIHRFESRPALHGGPKFSPDGRFVYFASRDGWVSKFDLYALQITAEVRVALNTRNLAVSADGRYLMVANYFPTTLVLLDARDLSLLRLLDVADERGTPSRVSAVYDAAPRQSFIAAMKDITEIWEISYADDPPYVGPVHDYRDEGPPLAATPFPIRRIHLEETIDDFFFDPDYKFLIGAARQSQQGQVIDLRVGRKIAGVDLPGLPHLGSGITWQYKGRPVLATPNLKEGLVSIIDMQNWQTIKHIKTLGPGFFMRSHEASRFAWVDVFFGPDKDAMHVIDKEKLEIVATIRPEPGKTSAHVEFTRDGAFALVSIWEQDGALIVYDANTLEQKTRLPMVKPSGKYNVYNKISHSTGTSH